MWNQTAIAFRSRGDFFSNKNQELEYYFFFLIPEDAPPPLPLQAAAYPAPPSVRYASPQQPPGPA
jgi:hypothetical protein